MSQRGVIRNREYAKQLRDYRGMVWGKISPTDIDGFIDFGGRLFVFIEGKHGNASMPCGQALALERLCRACHAPPFRSAIILLCTHDTDGDIDYAHCPVARYYWAGRWRQPRKSINVKEAVDFLLLRHAISK